MFRYATNATYVIDATGDGLAATRFDYDHPLTDPRLPLSSPGTLVLSNLLMFNGAIVPTGVHLTRPPLLSPGPPAVFGPIDVGLTPTLSIVGGNPMIVDRGAAFIDPGASAIDPCEGNVTERVVASGTVDVNTPGTYTITYDVTNAVGKRAATAARTVTVLNSKRLTSLGPARVWMGLKNDGDARFDLRAEVYKNGERVGSGQLIGVSGGNGSFNHSLAWEIPIQLGRSVYVRPHDELRLDVSVRISEQTRLKNAMVRLWYDDPEADSSLRATLDGADVRYYLRSGGLLSAVRGSGPRQEIKLALKDNDTGVRSLGIWKVIIE